MNYQGDFLEDATVYIPFNTFDSNDPSASVTITDLAAGDVEVWKDGVVQPTPGSGVTVTLNIGTGNGTHLIAVDTSNTTDAGWFVTGADFQVRINGTTIDSATVNAWVGTFSIENRFKEVTVTAITAGIIANASFNADVGSTAHGTNIIALACRKILEELNIDHLAKVDTTVGAAGDLTTYVVDGSILSHLMSNSDMTGYKSSEDSLNKIRDDRTLPAADYVVVGDTLAAVTNVGTVTGNVNGTVAGKTPAEIGDAMNLAADAIKAVSYDETTAFPVKSNDAGATQIARTGADGDTLKTLSDQIDGVSAGDATEAKQDTILSRIGTPANIDLGGASLAENIKKIADDNDGATFNATNHSLTSIRARGDTAWTTGVGGVAGAGAFEVTITIRTTGGTPIPGVSVWVNTSNDISGADAGARVTSSNGEVVFNLDYTTYYIFCHLAGYNFASASFTASVGNVTFIKDIGTVTSAGSSAFYSDSFLSRAIVDVRESNDEPQNNAKYTDARIIEHLEKSYILVLNEINRNSKTPAVAKITKTIASGTLKYTLPHTVGSVHGIYKLGDTGGRVFYTARSKHNPYGRGIWLENNTLHVQTTDIFGIGESLTIEYIPSGIARLHNGTYTVNSDGDVVTFGATPNVGTLDTHNEAYAGSIFRSLGADGSTITGNYLQERVITAYDETTRQATLDTPLSPIPTTDDGSLYYEIAPTISKGMDTVVALFASYRIMSNEGNRKRAKSILENYRNEIRNVRLTAYYSNMPEAPRDRDDNWDNRRYRRL